MPRVLVLAVVTLPSFGVIGASELVWSWAVLHGEGTPAACGSEIMHAVPSLNRIGCAELEMPIPTA